MAMVLQPTRLRVTQAIYFGKPQLSVGAGFVRTNGTTPLTANWNAGPFAITSLNSEDCLQAAEYGVVANGSLTNSVTGTDQTAAFVAALTDAVTLGKKLKLPSGVIKFTQNVVIPDIFGVTTHVHIDIEGAGNPDALAYVDEIIAPPVHSPQAGGTILKFWTGAGVHGLSLTPTNSLPIFTLRNIELQGPDTNVTATSGDGIHVVASLNRLRLDFHNVDVNHFRGGKGYSFDGPENGSCYNISASFCDVGMSLKGAANANNFYNTSIQYCASRGIEVFDVVEDNFYGGLMQSNEKTGFYFSGVAGPGGSAEECIVSGWHFENNNSTTTAGMHAVHVLAPAGTVGLGFLKFEGCWFSTANDSTMLDSAGPIVASVTFDTCRFQAVAPTINNAAVVNTLFLNSGAPLVDNGTATTIISDTLTGDASFGNDILTKGDLQVNGKIGAGGNPGTSALDVTSGTFRFSGNGVLTGYGGVEMTNVAGFGFKMASLVYDFNASDGVTNYATLTAGPAFGVGTPTPSRTLDVNGVQRWRGVAAPAVSEANSGTMYFDSATNTLKASLNGSAYVNVIGSGGLTGSGANTRIAYWDLPTDLTAPTDIYVDGPNNRLGIKVFPLYELDVNGDINIAAGSFIRVGSQKAISVETGIGNVQIGTIGVAVPGLSNTSVGHGALLNNTGDRNTALGYGAALSLVAGVDTTAAGKDALNQTTGDRNTGLGASAGFTNTTGTNNVCVGYQADVAAGNLTNAVAIGYQASVADNDSMELGNASMKVGIRTGGTPKTSLDIGGAISTRELGKVLVNGLNSDIALGESSFLYITGPGAAFSIGGFTGGTDGRRLTVYNSTFFPMTVVEQDTLSGATNRIKTSFGTVTLGTLKGTATFVYSVTEDRWLLEGSIPAATPTSTSPATAFGRNVMVALGTLTGLNLNAVAQTTIFTTPATGFTTAIVDHVTLENFSGAPTTNAVSFGKAAAPTDWLASGVLAATAGVGKGLRLEPAVNLGYATYGTSIPFVANVTAGGAAITCDVTVWGHYE